MPTPTTNYAALSSYINTQDPNNVELKKGFVFNETGNIMMSTTATGSNPIIESDVQKCFAEVSVFFAAMTRALERAAISGMTGVDRDGNSYNYSMYDYESMKKIIDNSGCFIQVNEDVILEFFTALILGSFFFQIFLIPQNALNPDVPRKTSISY